MRNATTGLVDHASVSRGAARPPRRRARPTRQLPQDRARAGRSRTPPPSALALLLSYWLRFGVRLLPAAWSWSCIGLAPLVWVLVFQAFSLYSPMYLSPAEEFRRTIGATGVGVVLLVMVSLLVEVVVLARLDRRSPGRWRCCSSCWRGGSGGCHQHRREAGRAPCLANADHRLDRSRRSGSRRRSPRPGSGFLPLGYVQPHGAQEAGDTLPGARRDRPARAS